MYERLSEQRWAISAVLSDRRCTKLSEARILELKDSHWRTLEEMIPVLQPLRIATTAVSQEAAVSLSCVTPIIVTLVNTHLTNNETDSQTVRDFKNIVKEDMKKRFGALFLCKDCEYDELSVYVIATFLDPKHKHFPYFSKEERDNIFKCMVKVVKNEDERGNAEHHHHSESEVGWFIYKKGMFPIANLYPFTSREK